MKLFSSEDGVSTRFTVQMSTRDENGIEVCPFVEILEVSHVQSSRGSFTRETNEREWTLRLDGFDVVVPWDNKVYGSHDLP